MDDKYRVVESLMKVRAKALPVKRKSLFRFLPYCVGVAILAVAGTLTFNLYSSSSGFFTPNFEVIESAAGRIIKVPAGGNVQAAIAKAESGDIVELQAGATYFGEIKLPNKPLNGFVTIQSSAVADLPVDKRVGPADAASMAKIVTRDAQPAVSAANGANHYRFVGIEFAPSTTTYVYNLLLLGSSEKIADVPHDIEIDRSYLHPFKGGVTRRGIALNSAATTIKNSYIEGFGFKEEEAQGICGWSGTLNAKILNNYIEGGAENILFGGSDPESAELIPTEIEIRGNHLNKPTEWRGKVTNKTLFELKNAKQVQFIGNILTNNFAGSAFRLTVRNQDGKAPFSTVEDVVIKDNFIDGAGEAINILGKDDTYPSQTLKRLNITNNLFLGIGAKDFEGSGYFVQIADGEEITIANNTVFNTGNTVTFYGTMARGLVFRDNIFGHGTYGVHGFDDAKSPLAEKTFQNNVFVNNMKVGSDDVSYPRSNFWIADYRNVGFVNLDQNDLNLSPSSQFKSRGMNKTDIGCDVKKLPSLGLLKNYKERG